MRSRCAIFVCVAVLLGAGSASASEASIKAVFKRFAGRIDVAEGHVLVASGEYQQTKNPAPVQKAIAESVGVLEEFKDSVAAQSAGTRRVRRAKADVVAGVKAVIAAYQLESTAFTEQAVDPQVAKTELAAAVVQNAAGQRELRQGVKLLARR